MLQIPVLPLEYSIFIPADNEPGGRACTAIRRLLRGSIPVSLLRGIDSWGRQGFILFHLFAS